MNQALTALGLLALVSGCAHSPTYDPQDPLEPLNRKVYAFNDTADRYVLRPVAKVYADVTPAPVRKGVGNFFDNLGYPITIVNDVLQLKLTRAAKDTGRFVMNSTIGLAGFMDVASTQGLTRNDEDFGQTLGRWGIGEGWYIMLPFLGPSTNRDLIGRVGDYFSDPMFFVEDDAVSFSLAAVEILDARAGLIGSAENFLNQQLDPYVAMRTFYLENRWNKIHDGNPPPDDGFEDF